MEMNLIDSINDLVIEQPRKTKKAFNYWYAPLEEVKRVIDAAIKGTGISYKQFYDYRDGGRILVTTLSKGAEMFSSVVPLVSNKDINNPQEFGSVSTYMRRYALSTMFNLVSEDDTDGNTETKGVQNDNTRNQGAAKTTSSASANGKPHVGSTTNVNTRHQQPTVQDVAPTNTLEEAIKAKESDKKKELVNHVNTIGLATIKEIQELATSKGIIHPQLLEFCHKSFGKSKLTDLTLAEANTIKERLVAKGKPETRGVV